MFSVGHQLMKARQARDLSIEDVAFATRIPHHRLREMENDDLSNFANLTYAKGFLKLYSRFLNLDLSDYLDEFDTSAVAEATGHEYVQTANLVRSLSAPAIAMDQGRNRYALPGLILLIAVIATVIWAVLKSSPRDTADNAPPPASSTSQATPPAASQPPSGQLAATTPSPASVSRGNPDTEKARPAPAARVPSSPPRALPVPEESPEVEVIPAPTPVEEPEEAPVRRARPVDENGNELPGTR